METVADFILGGSKITEDGDYCHEIKRSLFIERTDGEAEAPVLWPPDVKTQLNGKDPHAGKDRRQEEKGTTEDQVDEWYH